MTYPQYRLVKQGERWAVQVQYVEHGKWTLIPGTITRYEAEARKAVSWLRECALAAISEWTPVEEDDK